MPKNIVILSDGTGQIGGKGHDTNVYKLFRMLEDRTENQVVFYDEGIGTETQRVSGSVFGAGFDQNLLQCYRFLFDHYQSGDRIFLFGFSRGAATVRSLASFIHYFGILPASRPELIEQAYKIYINRQSSSDKQEEAPVGYNPVKILNRAVHRWNRATRYDLDDTENGESAKFVRLHPNQWVQIEFLGVWDTVPALGFILSDFLDSLLDLLPALKHSYHNFQLRRSVKHACHALSIDDDRKWFWPTIWKDTQEHTEWKQKLQEVNKLNRQIEENTERDQDLAQNSRLREKIEDDIRALKQEIRNSAQKVEQVWFGGSHTDVGGGFWEAGFSDIALEWMVQKAFEHGLRLYFGSRKYWNFCIAPDATDDFHDPRAGIGKIYSRGERNEVWDAAMENFGPPRIHHSVLDRARAFGPREESPADQLPRYDPWILKKGLDLQNEYLLNKEYRKKYQYDSLDAYQTLCLNTYRDTGERYPLSLEEWRRQHNPFDTWKTSYSFDDWKKENLDHLNGRQFLVERTRHIVYDPDGNALVLRDQDAKEVQKKPGTKVLVLRDYDRDAVEQVPKDKRLHLTLRNRVRKINPVVVAKLSRAQRKQLLRDLRDEHYLSRIDRDRERWGISESESLPGTSPDTART